MGSSPRIVADSLACAARIRAREPMPGDLGASPRGSPGCGERASRPPMELEHPRDEPRIRTSTSRAHASIDSSIGSPSPSDPQAGGTSTRSGSRSVAPRARSLDAANDRSAWPRRSARPPRRVVPAWRSPRAPAASGDHRRCRERRRRSPRENRRPRRHGNDEPCRHDAGRHEDRHLERREEFDWIEHEPSAPRAFGGHHARLRIVERTKARRPATASITPVPTRRSPPRTTAGRDPVLFGQRRDDPWRDARAHEGTSRPIEAETEDLDDDRIPPVEPSTAATWNTTRRPSRRRAVCTTTSIADATCALTWATGRSTSDISAIVSSRQSA